MRDAELDRTMQFDDEKRVVSLPNLEAMCKRISGTAHVFTVTSITPASVHVEYSNPSEYGTPNPMTAVFPAYTIRMHGKAVIHVLLGDFSRIINDTWDGEGWQAFQPLLDCPKLWRSGMDTDDWKTREEIEAGK